MWPIVPLAPKAFDAGDAKGTDAEAEPVEEQEPSWEDWPVQAKLATVLDYLRQTYQYCIFCGCQVSLHPIATP